MYIQSNLTNFYRTKEAGIKDYLKALLMGAGIGGIGGGLGGAGYGYREDVKGEADWSASEADRLASEVDRQASLDEILGTVTDNTHARFRKIMSEMGNERRLNELRQEASGLATEQQHGYLDQAGDRYNFHVGQLQDAEFPLSGAAVNFPAMIDSELGAMNSAWEELRGQEGRMSELDAALTDITDRTTARTRGALDSRKRVQDIVEGLRAEVAPAPDKPELSGMRDRGLQGAGIGALVGGAGGLGYQALKDLLF